MVGYNGFSMSNNAVNAYENGLIPASKIKGIPASLVKQFCGYSEWHHSSKFYNKVEFYDPDYVRAIFGLCLHEEYDPDPEAIKALAEFKTNKNKPKKEEYFENCRVSWLEWGGTRKHPLAKVRIEFNASVCVFKNSAKITLECGMSFVKRLNTNGFSFSTTFKEDEKIAWIDKKLQSLAKAEMQIEKHEKEKIDALIEYKKKTSLRKEMAKSCIRSNEFLEFNFEPSVPVRESPEALRFFEWFKSRHPEAAFLDIQNQAALFQQIKQNWLNCQDKSQ